MLKRMIEFSLQKRFVAALLALLVMAGGYWSYRQLPVDAFPDISPNLVQVFTVTEGLAPEEVEKYVTYPVEAAMTGLPGVQKVRSISNFGLSVVNVYFDDGMDIYFCRQLVSERLQEARKNIPEGFGEPEMGPISTGMGLVLYYYLEDSTGRYSLTELRTMQDWIVKLNLQTVPGVTEVLGIGGFEKQFQVNIDPNALLQYKLSLGDIIQRIKANNINIGAQFLEKHGEQLVVRSTGLAGGTGDLKNIVLKTVDGRPIYLSDVARIETGGAIRQGLQTKDGEGEVVAGMVMKLYGTNSSTVIERVEERIGEINQSLPEGVRIVPYYQQRDIVEASVNTVLSALLQGIALVALVLLLFMGGLRPSLVVVLVIPFSVLFAFAAMRLFGISANLMSLGGLAIAIGMMVDGTIVMVDNVDRMLREAKANESRLHVVGRACREVARPILFAISIIIIVFLPLFSLSGVEGKTFRPLAFTVSAAMLGSLIFALLLAPFFSHLFMRRPRGAGDGRDAAAREALLIRLIGGPYQKLIAFFVRRRWAAVSLAAVILAIGAAIFPLLGSEFTPRLREGNLLIRFTMAPSISLEEGKRNMALVEKRLLRIPEVAGAVTRLGRGEVGAHADPVNNAEMFVILKPRDQWRGSQSQEEIEAVIRRELGEVPGAQVNLSQPVEATVDELLEGVKAELAIKIFGDDLALLKQKADQVQGVIKEVPGAADVQVDQVTGTPQLLIRPSREAVARYGLNLADVQETIRTAVGGTTAGQVYDGVRRFDIYVRYQAQARQTQEAIEEILVQAPNGRTVPLTDLAEVKEVVGPRQITRENNQRFITIQCNVTGRDIGSFVSEAQEAIAAKIKLPPGYFITWGGMFRLQQEANKRLSVVVPVTLLLICLLLFSSFGSIKNSILILLNIPLALVGGVVALWLSGQNMSVPATVGFIALFGIALENGMVLVTYINQLVRDGVAMDEAAERAARLRLRSVLMTAATTSLGLIPLLLASGTGSEVQRPLATVVVGGLATSTILTLLVLPAMYQWFAIKIARKEDFRGNQPQGGTV